MPVPAIPSTPAISCGRALLFRFLLSVLLCSFTAGLTACALGGGSSSGSSTDRPAGVTAKKGAPGTRPYTIRGKTYYPLLSSHGFREEGIASWYGEDFHGKQTANGERYDMYGMTAAHKLLPFGTKVKVTNRTNGKFIVVRINDRGPFVANRIIDLTRTGAEKIGMIARGTAPVMLETQGSVAGLRDGELAGNFYVQAGAFANKSNAEGLASRLKSQGMGARVVWAEQVGFWRVQAGPYTALSKAENAADAMSAEFPNSFVVAD